MKSKYNKSGKSRGISKDDSGVSPVIAVILMVAITVVMAAIVSSWSAGVKSPTTPTTVGLDISRSSTNITTVVTSIDPASAAPITNITLTYQYYNGTGFNPTSDYMLKADVGDSKSVDTNSTQIKQFIVIATFKDSSKKVLYSRET